MIAPSFLLKDSPRRIGHARRGAVVFGGLDLFIFMAELADDRLFARKQADVAEIEPRIQQFLDSALEHIAVRENADHLSRPPLRTGHAALP